MKQLTIAVIIALGSMQLNAQDFSISEAGSAEMERQKEAYVNSFTTGNTHYYVTKYYTSPTWAYEMQTVNADGTGFQSSKLEISVGEFKNNFSISEVIGLENQAYAIVENYNSDDGERVLTARKLDPNGEIAENGTDIMMINFEKMLRPGRLITAVSPDRKRLATIGVLPFNKKESRKFKVAVYDENLKEISSSEIKLEGESIKNARFEAVVANDGTVYINRYSSKMKDGVKIVVHQYDSKSSSLTEIYEVRAAEGDVMGNYFYTTNPKGELIIAAAFRKDVKLYTGDEEQSGLFIFRNEGKSEAVIEYNDLDTPAANFEITGIHFSEETIFVTGEEAKEEKSSPANTTPSTANTTYTYTHEEEYIVGFNMSGKKMFELILDQKLTATNSTNTLYSAAHVIGGKLVYIYNDQFSKYRDVDDIAGSGTIPIAVTVTPGGLMTPAVPFLNDLKLSNGYTLLPAYSQASGATITLLARDGKTVRAVQISAN